MRKNERSGLRKMTAVLAAAVLFTGIDTLAPAITVNAAAETEDVVAGLLDVIHDTVGYEEYLAAHADAPHPAKTVVVAGTDYKEASEGFTAEADGLNTLEDGSVTYEVEVEEAGFYNILLDYYPTKGKNNSIERELYINGEIPFENAQYLEFSRIWRDAEEIKRDSRDNDVRPKQEEAGQWLSAYMADSDGYYEDSFQFYFEKGVNTITLVSTKEPMKIGRITLTQEEALPTYAEYLAAHASAPQVQLAEPVKVQGEDAVYKSDSTLYPIADRTSPLSEPYSPSKTRLNVIGGSNWKQVGQWLTWELTVPQDGMYEIALRYRQNINTGVTVVRSVLLDGQLPFEEARECKFYFNNDWQVVPLGIEDGETFQFYLTAGTHTLQMKISLGEEMSEIIRRTDVCISELNRAYRQLLMVIGSSPDTMRDYQLPTRTPEALAILKEQYENISEIRRMVDDYMKGTASSSTATVDNLVNQLQRMTEDPRTIARQWSAFKDNIVSLGSWQLSMKEQPLEIDYILAGGVGMELPKAEAGFFQKAVHEIKQFAASFVEDYDSIGEVYEGEALQVWILADGNVTSMSGGGRDQATVIKDLVDNYFVPEQNIPVNVKLVNKDVLLSATLAGEGPDVALNVAGVEPVNYALRNAVVDLTQFEDFDEVRDWFHDEALTQFTFNGGVYALPQTMSFHVMFYRADILTDLGIEIPRTWDDFYEALAVIQKSNMNIGITPDYTTFAMFLYQHGGQYYTDDAKRSGLDTEEAIDAFKQWSGNYVNYRMPVTFDFANRFRTGEMPLAIGDYTQYNYLSVFAPEIRGLWGFTIVPAYEREDGTLDHSVSSWETGAIIMETSDQKQEAWKFLKWWMSAETQTSYGNEIENVLGVSGRVATANMEALASLPWSNRDYRQLMAELQWVKAIPQIPGGYYTERNIKNAFYTVYNNNEDPRETLQDIVKTINTEIDAKRKEFGLPLAD